MNSKEVLEYLRTCKYCKIVMGTDYENDDRYFTLYDVFSEEIEIIQKDLERLEKLEKVIDILKDKFKFELGVSVIKEKYYYSLEFLYTDEYLTITQDQYELLKEVLEK